MRYLPKPLPVEAMQIPADRDGFWRVYEWVDDAVEAWDDEPFRICIRTPFGGLWANEGDWIVMDDDGNFWPMRNEHFSANYEPV